MSEPRSTAVYLEDILDAAESGIRFIAGMSCEEFAADKKTVFAVTRALEIIGEATKRISEEFKAQNPALPWRVMAGMRDKLIHDYSGVNLQVLWNTVIEDLPKLGPEIRSLLSQLQD